MRVLVRALLVQVAAGAAWAVPSNDACGAAVVIGAVPFADTRSVTGATAAADDPGFDCAEHGFGDEPSVWYRYTAPAAVSLQIDTFGSDYDTVVAVRASTGGASRARAHRSGPPSASSRTPTGSPRAGRRASRRTPAAASR